MPTPIRESLQLELPDALARVLADCPELSQALLVGGCVRDALLGVRPEDFDVEVYGVGFDALALALAHHGRTDVVGRAFGVIKLTLDDGRVVDFGIPRSDSRTGTGHRGFAIVSDPALSAREAAARRDFTLNALAWDPRRCEAVDHFGGLADLRAGVLRHTSAAFGEDPLRVLRAMQFAARFRLAVHPETVQLCRSIVPAFAELPRERVWQEWRKFAARATRPSAGLDFLRECGWLAHFPELAALVDTPQDPEWHPEGDVWRHTLHALDALVRDPEWLAAGEEARIVWSFAVLLHDTGKPAHTQREMRRGIERVTSPGHEGAGGPLAEAFLERIGAPHACAERVVPLVTQHMAHLQSVTDRAVRRLALRLAPESIASFAVVVRADAAGRPPLSSEPPDGLVALLRAAESLRLAHDRPRPILMGRDLLERGWTSGPGMGRVLAAAFEAQLDGAFADREGALGWLESHGEPAGRRLVTPAQR